MSEDQFGKLFKYVQEGFSGVDKRFDEVHNELIDIRGAIAELSAQVRDYHQEMVILSHQVDKMREAIKQIARETGVKLSVEL